MAPLRAMPKRVGKHSGTGSPLQNSISAPRSVTPSGCGTAHGWIRAAPPGALRPPPRRLGLCSADTASRRPLIRSSHDRCACRRPSKCDRTSAGTGAPSEGGSVVSSAACERCSVARSLLMRCSTASCSATVALFADDLHSSALTACRQGLQLLCVQMSSAGQCTRNRGSMIRKVRTGGEGWCCEHQVCVHLCIA
jgi:hypothetical protein